VDAVGSVVTNFKKGDAVFYASELFPSMMPHFKGGAYAEYNFVDESIVAHKPKELTFLEAAALPL
jgi:NADPH:quinone reductase-like Zn-dependent oxidoreductase